MYTENNPIEIRGIFHILIIPRERGTVPHNSLIIKIIPVSRRFFLDSVANSTASECGSRIDPHKTQICPAVWTALCVAVNPVGILPCLLETMGRPFEVSSPWKISSRVISSGNVKYNSNGNGKGFGRVSMGGEAIETKEFDRDSWTMLFGFDTLGNLCTWLMRFVYYLNYLVENWCSNFGINEKKKK